MSAYRIRWESGESPRDRTILYEEGELSLRIACELAGFGVPYDQVAGLEATEHWTAPPGVAVDPAHGAEVRQRIVEWGKQQGVRIGFEPARGFEIVREKMIRAGYEAQTQADGSVVWRPRP